MKHFAEIGMQFNQALAIIIVMDWIGFTHIAHSIQHTPGNGLITCGLTWLLAYGIYSISKEEK